MSSSLQCPECHRPLSSGETRRCRKCRRVKKAVAAKPTFAPARARVLQVVTATAAVALLALAGWFGGRLWSQPREESPTTTSEPAADPLESPSPLAQAPELPVTVPTEPDNPVGVTALAPIAVPPPPQEPALDPDKGGMEEAAPPPTPFVGPELPPQNKALVRRRSDVTEDDLKKQLLTAPEVGLARAEVPALVRAYREEFTSTAGLSSRINFDPFILLRLFPQAGFLPLRSGPACQLGQKEALTLGALAPKLHAYLDVIAPLDKNGQRTNPTLLRETLRQEMRGKRPEWLRAEALPTMLQILMPEDVPLRLMLVDMLAEIQAPRATMALAQRAVFDLSPEVRQAAIEALRGRPRNDYRPVLLEALRYPWPPPADHAAEALVALDDQEAAPLLVNLLGKSDPAAPFSTGKKGTAIRHLVRINHRANCLLCHAPALGSDDPVTGVDPITRLPGGRGGGGGGGWGGGGRSSGGGGSSPLLVRPDVTFLRQDFSIQFPIGIPGIAVQGVRFDYVTLTRPLTSAERKAQKQQAPPDPTAFPQRDAILFALRALTGKDVGATTEAWRQLFPRADAESEGVRLSASLLKAPPEQRDPLLARYRESKDDHYTEALACAIPHLASTLQEKVRAALVERMSRLPAALLRARLQDDDTELRHAAALACTRKSDKELVPDLIPLLLALEPEVVAGAHDNLHRLTGEDFGPRSDAAQEERAAAAAAWQTWWRRQEAP
jgi:HEAT repeat protein